MRKKGLLIKLASGTVMLLVLILGARTGFFSSRRSEQVSIGRYRPKHFEPGRLSAVLAEPGGKYVVIDARTKLEYDKGHIPGAVHADYHDTEALVEAARDRTPVTYDAFSSMRGIYAAYVLYLNGHKDVGILLGGLNAWVEDIGILDAADPSYKSVFMHPKDIFPKREKGRYPKNAGTAEIAVKAVKFRFVPDRIQVKHGQTVVLHITSVDVIHGFSLPEYGIEEELMPGKTVTVKFIADRKGDFPFVTNTISGSGYSSMVGLLVVQ